METGGFGFVVVEVAIVAGEAEISDVVLEVIAGITETESERFEYSQTPTTTIATRATAPNTAFLYRGCMLFIIISLLYTFLGEIWVQSTYRKSLTSH